MYVINKTCTILPSVHAIKGWGSNFFFFLAGNQLYELIVTGTGVAEAEAAVLKKQLTFST